MVLRKVLARGLVALVLGVAAILLVLHGDLSLDTEVLIDRPPVDVWKVVSDSAAYPAWNPFITRVDGDFKEGATVRIVLGAAPDSVVFRPTILLVRPAHALCWRGSLWIRGIFDGEHCIRLAAIAGGTRLEQTERFSGLLVGKLTQDVVEDTRRQFQAMNSALKKRVEAQASQ